MGIATALFPLKSAIDVVQLEKDIQKWINDTNYCNLQSFNDGAAQIISNTFEIVSQLTNEPQIKNLKKEFESFCYYIRTCQSYSWGTTSYVRRDNNDLLYTDYCCQAKKIVREKINNPGLDKNSFEVLMHLASILNYDPIDSQILFSELMGFSPHYFIDFDPYFTEIFKDPSIVDYVMRRIIEQLPFVEIKRNCIRFLKKSIADNKEYTTLIGDQIKKNAANVLKSISGIDLYEELSKKDPSLYPILEQIVLQHIEMVHPKALILVNKQAPKNNALKKALKRYIKNNKTVDCLIKVWLYNFSCKDGYLKIHRKGVTPTEQHLKHFVTQEDYWSSYSCIENCLDTLLSYKDDTSLQAMVLRIISKEKELQRNYYTFVHGQRLHYLFLEQLHTFLYKEINNLIIGDFLLLHVKEVITDKRNEKKLRNTILEKGRTSQAIRERLLFANHAFFGNLTNGGSCSAQYIASNSNISDFNFSIKEVFSLHNLNHLYARFNKRLQDLYDRFNKLSTYGACILIAIPKETAHKQVYIARPGGYKRKVGLNNTTNTIADMHTLADYLQNKPEAIADIDQIEFCIPMTFDKKGGLNPQSGIKYFPYIAADSQLLNEYYRAQEQLFDRIKYEIRNPKKGMFSFLTNLYALIN